MAEASLSLFVTSVSMKPSTPLPEHAHDALHSLLTPLTQLTQLTQLTRVSAASMRSVLAWSAWLRRVAVLPVVLWLAVWWAHAETWLW